MKELSDLLQRPGLGIILAKTYDELHFQMRDIAEQVLPTLTPEQRRHTRISSVFGTIRSIELPDGRMIRGVVDDKYRDYRLRGYKPDWIWPEGRL